MPHWLLVREIWIARNANSMDEQNKPEKEEVPEEFSTLKEAGLFWDTNSTADHGELTAVDTRNETFGVEE